MAYTYFKPRTTKPTSSDLLLRCYIRQKDGYNGWNGCVLGSPTDSEANVLSNCTGYAQGRFCEIYDILTGYHGTNKWFYLNCTAGAWLERAKQTYPDLELGGPDDDPRPGAILVWAGHVAIVEQVIDKDTVFTSESAYNGKAFFNLTRKRENNWTYDKQFLGYIYNPAVQKLNDIVDPVEQNILVDQIKVNTDVQNVRTGAGRSYQSLGTAKSGYYNVLEIKDAEGYTWYKIAEDQWIAHVNNRVEYIPKSVFHAITVQNVPRGTIQVDKCAAAEGMEVVITPVPDSGCKFVKATANGIEIKDNKFIMPNESEVITGEFENQSFWSILINCLISLIKGFLK